MYEMVLFAPFVVENLLPCNLTYRFPEFKVETTLKKGESVPIYNVNPAGPFNVVVQIPHGIGYFVINLTLNSEKHWSRETNLASKDSVITFSDQSGRELNLNIDHKYAM